MLYYLLTVTVIDTFNIVHTSHKTLVIFGLIISRTPLLARAGETLTRTVTPGERSEGDTGQEGGEGRRGRAQ